MNVAAIIVTYNRPELLKKCIKALINQSLRPNKIIIIDNASNEDTNYIINDFLIENSHLIKHIKLNQNTGGAGGFYTGLKFAFENGYDWAWIMDDDALPDFNAFEKLHFRSLDTNNIYGSIAIDGEYTSWKTTLLNKENHLVTNKVEDIPTISEVTFLPFLGLLLHSSTIKKIGLPDRDFFIAGDDFQYCLRARKAGLKIIVIGQSRIYHPKAETHTSVIFGFKVDRLKIPPWKDYYNTRNKILIAKKYYGHRLLTKTLPGIIIRLFLDLLFERQKLAHVHAVLTGLFDGFLGLKGKRHQIWKIK